MAGGNWSTSREVRGSPATIEYYGRRLLLRGRCSTWSTSVSFCVAGAPLAGRSTSREVCAEVRRRLSTMDAVAGAALGALQARFAWQVQHLEHLHRGAEVCVAGAALGAPQSHFAMAGRTWSTSVSFCWRQHSVHLSVILRVQHLEDLSLILRGRCSTWKTSVSFCVAVQHLEHHPHNTIYTTSSDTPLSTQHHLHNTSHNTTIINTTPSYTSPSTQHHLHNTICTTPSTQHHLHITPINTHHHTSHHQTHHHQHNTISTTSSTQPQKHNLINTTPSTQHHLHNTIYTTPPTQHHLSTSQTHHHQHNTHLHITIYTVPFTQHHLHHIINTTPSTQHHQTTSSTHTHTPSTLHQQHHIINTTSSTHHHYITPSTQHHLHNTIHTTPSTLHHQTLAGAALGALPSYPFCLIPADSPFCFSSLWIVLCFVSLTYSTVGCPKTLLTCGVIRLYLRALRPAMHFPPNRVGSDQG